MHYHAILQNSKLIYVLLFVSYYYTDNTIKGTGKARDISITEARPGNTRTYNFMLNVYV